MKFIFENLGTVESALIDVDGLTVITGLNDTGKSFLSKTIYGIIQTNKEAVVQSRFVKSQAIQDYFQKMQNAERLSVTPFPPSGQPVVNFTVNSVDLFRRINESFTNRHLIPQVELDLDSYHKVILDNLKSNKHPGVATHIINQTKIVTDTVVKIKTLLAVEDNPEKDNIEFFNKIVIQQLFKGQINNITIPDSTCKINVFDGSNEIVCLTIKNNNIDDFKGSLNNFFTDAVLIESPITLQLITFIHNGLAFGGSLLPIINLYQPRIAGLPLHFYDLIKKIVNNVGNTPASEEFLGFISKIKEIIGGKVYYDPVSKSILFDKENHGTIGDYNIASGIKSLGMLGILLAENILNKKTLLIIDEPEVHLHPKWEIQYAELIVKLSKSGIPIVISSHSPYLIESLLKYSRQYKIEDKTKFYFGRQSESGFSIFEETTNLRPIFKVLAEPMQALI